jgi:hypothetical protein
MRCKMDFGVSFEVSSEKACYVAKLGDPYGNRTRVASVKGMCPNR